MAKVRQRTWTIPGQRTKRKAWGFSVTIGGKRIKNYRTDWTREMAEKALAAAQLEVKLPGTMSGMSFAEAIDRYLLSKARKRALKEDRRQLAQLKDVFGSETALSAITASRISEYKATRMSTVSCRTGRSLTAAAINRPLALLRHLLHLAHVEWEVLPLVPRIRLEKEPQGRIRWLEPEEEARLLAACSCSQNTVLAAIVTIAIETGMRKGELLDLTWDRVDMTRGVIRLEETKSGRRREVPMRQAVYNVLAGLPGPHEGRVWPAGSIRTAFEHAVEVAQLDNFHFHDLRHTFASRFIMAGGSLPALQQILGHATLAMTMRYSHLSPKHLREEMARTGTASDRAQDRAHDLTELVEVSQKSLK